MLELGSARGATPSTLVTGTGGFTNRKFFAHNKDGAEGHTPISFLY